MARYTKLVRWAFNGDLFARSIVSLMDNFTIQEIAELIGVSQATIYHWSKGEYQAGFEHPNMSNFLIVCDQLDIDPREMFLQEDVE